MRTSGYIVGNLSKRIPDDASTCTFEIGGGANYTPVVLTFAGGTTAGSITASTTGTEHGSLAESGIDPGKSVNRFWTLINAGVGLPVAGFSATFNFINGSPIDFDGDSNPGNFIVQRWDGTNWLPTTVNATCTSTPGTNLCEQVNGLRAFGDFAIGEGFAGFNSAPGIFNVFETSTPAGRILGRIHTKLANAPITLDVVALNLQRNGVNINFNQTPITVELLDARDNSGALTANTNCRTSWSTPALFSKSYSPTWDSGRATIPIPALGNAARDVRVRVSFTIFNITFQACSTDRFAIRPTGFTSITSNNMASSGKPLLKTGETFTLTAATGLSGYDNGAGSTAASPQVVPSIDSSKVNGSPIAGTIGGAFAAATNGAATGNNAFFYSEAGNFTIGVNGVFDSSFTAVDQPIDCTPDFWNGPIPVNGKYGCNFGNLATSAPIGRFIPDNFAVTLNTPQLGTACAAGGFTYVGQRFAYTTAPVITVSARSGTTNGLTNQVTQNYTGAWWKLTNATLTGKAYMAASGTLDTISAPATDPVIVDAFATSAIDADRGIGTLTFSSGTGPNAGFLFTRSTPSAPFDADISLSINVQDSDGVAASTNPVQFNLINFSNGRQMRFGRLKLGNAMGSELLNLPIPIETQYWNGTGFVKNSQDNCTTISANNISLTNPAGGINTSNMPQSSVVAGAAFVGGIGSLRLNKPSPTPTSKGSVNVCVDLGPDPAPSCAASASANMPWLQGRWSAPATFDDDPTVRATFGVYRAAPIIYMRELY
jgi:hypothetical protein